MHWYDFQGAQEPPKKYCLHIFKVYRLGAEPNSLFPASCRGPIDWCILVLKTKKSILLQYNDTKKAFGLPGWENWITFSLGSSPSQGSHWLMHTRVHKAIFHATLAYGNHQHSTGIPFLLVTLIFKIESSTGKSSLLNRPFLWLKGLRAPKISQYSKHQVSVLKIGTDNLNHLLSQNWLWYQIFRTDIW